MLDDLDKPIYGVDAIAAAANLTRSKAYYALEKGHLPASKLGKIWFSTPRRLRAFLNGEAKPVEAA
jgi:hypothetical protein